MKKLVTLAMLFCLIFAGCATIGSRNNITLEQFSVHNQSKEKPIFWIHAFNIADPEFSPDGVINVIVNIPYPELRFNKTKTGEFYAPYEVDVWLMHSGQQIKYQHINKIVYTPDYWMTQNYAFSALTIIQFNVPKENYLVRIRVANTRTGEMSEKTISAQKRNIMPNSFNISDPVYMRESTHGKTFFSALFDTLPAAPVITLLNPQIFALNKTVNACFEIYFPRSESLSLENKKIAMVYKIIKQDNVILEKKQLIQTAGKKQKVHITIPITLPENYGNGWYKLNFQAYIKDQDPDTVAAKSAEINKFVQFFSHTLRTKDEQKVMIKALEYIGPDKFIKKLKHAKTHEAKLKLFNKFWQRQNRSLQARIYNRVAHVLKHYDGFGSEKAEIILKFGLPDDIVITSNNNIMIRPMDPIYERGEFEIWHYYNLRSAIIGRSHKIFKFSRYTSMRPYSYNNDELWDYNPEKIFQ